MHHDVFDLEAWIAKYPLESMDTASDINYTLTGPLPVAYVEQLRRKVKKKKRLGTALPVDLFVWNLGDSDRRDITRIGGVPYWPKSEPWPYVDPQQPYTFLAQFCFLDSRDITPKLPGDILSILCAGPAFQDIQTRWFTLGNSELLAADEIPRSSWTIHPCHAALHRTVDYVDSDPELFDDVKYPLSLWARVFREATKIAGRWWYNGELPDPEEEDDYPPEIWEQIEKDRELLDKWERTYLCHLGSVQPTQRQPFINVQDARRTSLCGSENLLMIFDVGTIVVFFDGEETSVTVTSG